MIGIALAADLALRYGNVLVVAAEIMSRRIADADPGTAILFGDGAGACLVSRDNGFAQIVDTALFTDGNYAESLQLAHAGTIQMKGLEVILQASRKIPRAIGDLLAKHEIPPTDVGVFLMHQANVNLLRKVAASLKVPEDRFFSNIANYGNTSSASLLIAGAEWRAAHPEAITAPLILAAFGAASNGEQSSPARRLRATYRRSAVRYTATPASIANAPSPTINGTMPQSPRIAVIDHSEPEPVSRRQALPVRHHDANQCREQNSQREDLGRSQRSSRPLQRSLSAASLGAATTASFPAGSSPTGSGVGDGFRSLALKVRRQHNLLRAR